MGPAAATRGTRRRTSAGLGFDIFLIIGTVILAGLVVRAAERTGRPTADSAEARIERDPLDLAALRDLGLRQDRDGREDQADAIMSFVGRRSWRDTPTEAWLLRRRLSQGRLAEALQIADSLIRQDLDGARRTALFPALVAAAGYVEGRPPLEARLALSPPWRSDFLAALAVRGDITGTDMVFSDLAAGPNPPTPAEYAPFVMRLVSTGDYPYALQAWSRIARRPGEASQAVRDGDFAGAADGTAFTWRPADGVGAGSEERPAPDDPARRALQVDYDGYSAPKLPAQLMALPAGGFRVSWRQRSDPADVSTLFWRVRCADTGQILAIASIAAQSPGEPAGWRRMAMDIRVPTTGCSGQWLELTAAPGDRRDPVTAWYEAFEVARQP